MSDEEYGGVDVVMQQNPNARKYRREGKKLYQGGVEIQLWQLTDDELKKHGFATEHKQRMAKKDRRYKEPGSSQEAAAN